MTAPTPDKWSRDGRGRFGPDNQGGPGGSKGRRSEFRQAIENAISPEHAAAIIRKATHMGMSGNTKAMEIVLDHVSGRPSEAPVAPQKLDLPLPELTSNDACRRASDIVLTAMNKGDVDRKTAKTMLDSIQKVMVALDATRKEHEAAGMPGAPERPIPNAVLHALVANFQRSGQLPEDAHTASAVVRKVKAGFVALVEPSSTMPNSVAYDGFVAKPREKDPVMDALLDEAASGTGLVRGLARLLLKNTAEVGLDVTALGFQRLKLPKHGSASMYLTGFFDRLAVRPYAAQARRLFARLEAAAEQRHETAQAYWDWRDRAEDAITCFQHAGIRPEDQVLLETALNAGEMSALINNFCGEDVRDVMPLFDAAATSTGPAREEAINALLALARKGRFSQGRTVDDEPPKAAVSRKRSRQRARE